MKLSIQLLKNDMIEEDDILFEEEEMLQVSWFNLYKEEDNIVVSFPVDSDPQYVSVTTLELYDIFGEKLKVSESYHFSSIHEEMFFGEEAFEKYDEEMKLIYSSSESDIN